MRVPAAWIPAVMLPYVTPRFGIAVMYLLLAAAFTAVVASSPLLPTYSPVRFAVGTTPTISTSSYNGESLTLTPENPVLTLDYGTESSGYAFLQVDHVTGPCEVEFKFSEPFVGLTNPYGDGPWTFSNGLSGTFSTETHTVFESGSLQTYFLQGGFRWQSVTLSPGSHNITLSAVGIRSVIDQVPPPDLPGAFHSSSDMYNDIWDLGARAVQAACVPAYSAPSTWELTSQGVYIRGQQPALSANATAFNDFHSLSFSTKIARGGTGWTTGSSDSSYTSLKPYFVLTSNYPPNTTFVNTNRTLLPPNTVTFGYGKSLVNQTTLETGPVIHYNVSLDVKEDTWYRVTTKLSNSSYVISLDGRDIAVISQAEYHGLYPTAPATVSSGAVGFGPFLDQAAYYKDVEVRSSNGSLMYSNSMMSSDIFYEFGIHENTESVCLDGPKRDRLVWIGDFAHTARTLGTTTNRLDFIRATAEFCFARQSVSGPVPIAAAMGSPPSPQDASLVGLTDYQMFFLNSVYTYYELSGDLDFIRRHWSQMKLIATALLGLVDPYSGLMAGSAYYFIGPGNGTATSSLMTYTLRQMSEMATELGDLDAKQAYAESATSMSDAVQQLWSDALGTFALSNANFTDFSVTGIAFSILSGIANPDQAQSSILEALPRLYNKIGYRDQSTSDVTEHISPNTNGFLLEAIMLTVKNQSRLDRNLTDALAKPAKLLLDGLWRNMVVQDEFYTGASWEYMYPDGTPGLDLFTSLSHPWGSAPSYVLPEYVLGIKAITPGWRRFVFQPFIRGLGLNWVTGRVNTPLGEIYAEWRIQNSTLELTVDAPAGTEALIILPSETSSYAIDGDERNTTQSAPLSYKGGKPVAIFAQLS